MRQDGQDEQDFQDLSIQIHFDPVHPVNNFFNGTG